VQLVPQGQQLELERGARMRPCAEVRRSETSTDIIAQNRVLVLVTEPELATGAYRALHEKRLALQRMPRIVDRDLLSVVGGM
jgi:hypothetical protein